jgi:hypothetical protein
VSFFIDGLFNDSGSIQTIEESNDRMINKCGAVGGMTVERGN